MEKWVLDFAVDDVYGECAARWELHCRESLSKHLFRRGAARVGAQCEAVVQGRLQEELKPRSEAAENRLTAQAPDGPKLSPARAHSE